MRIVADRKYNRFLLFDRHEVLIKIGPATDETLDQFNDIIIQDCIDRGEMNFDGLFDDD